MEEKERYELLNDSFIYDNKLKEYVGSPCASMKLYAGTLTDLLNQQDKRIKELQANNEILKTSKSHFKKVAENVVDLLGKLNKFIGEPQIRELNYCKVIEDTKNYIEELKQSQKQLAISELEKVRDFMILSQDIISLSLCSFVSDRIEKLKYN